MLGSQWEPTNYCQIWPQKAPSRKFDIVSVASGQLSHFIQIGWENKLHGPALMDYLSYTTKIYQLVHRFSLVSVLLYDREYRKLQAPLIFRWGMDVQHLSNIHLQAQDKPVGQSSQSNQRTNGPVNAHLRPEIYNNKLG